MNLIDNSTGAVAFTQASDILVLEFDQARLDPQRVAKGFQGIKTLGGAQFFFNFRKLLETDAMADISRKVQGQPNCCLLRVAWLVCC